MLYARGAKGTPSRPDPRSELQLRFTAAEKPLKDSNTAEGLFGQASVEVRKDAVKKIISQVPKDQMPQLLL